MVTVQRYRFYSRFQHSEESISAFVAELRSLARDCDFGRALEDNLRDKLVCAVADQALQRKLLTEKDLTFQRALDVARSHESAKKNVATLHGSQAAAAVVHEVKAVSSSPCYRCGRKGHLQTQCKFKTATCHACGKLGHIKPVCRSLSSPRSSSSARSSTPRSSGVSSPSFVSPFVSIRHESSEFVLHAYLVLDRLIFPVYKLLLMSIKRIVNTPYLRSRLLIPPDLLCWSLLLPMIFQSPWKQTWELLFFHYLQTDV